MLSNELSRYQLYKIAAENVEKAELTFKDSGLVSSILSSSSDFLKEIEMLTWKHQNSERFFSLFESSLDKINNSDFKEYLLVDFREKRNGKETLSSSFDEWFSYILSSVIKYQNKIIETNYVFDEKINGSNSDRNIDKKTFLSYAYNDKGLSLALYIYFKLNGGFLYVDWMWNGKATNANVLKMQLDDELRTSNQLLFLRTTASELKVKGNYSVRQWCSWEIGNYYTKKPDQKFILALYNSSVGNFMLNTFRVMKGVKNGTMFD